MDGTVSIINLFCKDLTKEYTIRHISQLLKKSYAYTNKEVWSLIKQNILRKKEIGKSIVCSLNILNKKTKTILTLNSSLNSPEVDIQELKEKDVYTAFFSNKKLHIVVREIESFKINSFETKTKILTKREFISFIKKDMNNNPVYGFEKYWEIIGDIYEE